MSTHNYYDEMMYNLEEVVRLSRLANERVAEMDINEEHTAWFHGAELEGCAQIAREMMEKEPSSERIETAESLLTEAYLHNIRVYEAYVTI